MIDWITAIVPLRHKEPVFGGSVMGFDIDGALSWKRDSFRQLEGSFESSSVCQTYWRTEARRGWEECSELWISGNPAKFLQGHNLFGSDNLPSLAPQFFTAVVRSLGLEVDAFTAKRWMDGDYQLDRVDVAYMIDVGGTAEVRDVLAALAHQATVCNRGRGLMQAGTVSWGKRSSRQSVLKCYDKHGELHAGKKHQLPEGIPHREELAGYALGKVRIETELHSRFLEARGVRKGANWHSDTAGLIWSSVMEKLNLSAQVPLSPSLLKLLPSRLQRTYMMWETGRDLRGWMSYATFKRHRRDLLRFGVDIAQVHNPGYTPKVVSLSKVIKGTASPVPAWARGTVLLAAA